METLKRLIKAWAHGAVLYSELLAYANNLGVTESSLNSLIEDYKKEYCKPK